MLNLKTKAIPDGHRGEYLLYFRCNIFKLSHQVNKAESCIRGNFKEIHSATYFISVSRHGNNEHGIFCCKSICRLVCSDFFFS